MRGNTGTDRQFSHPSPRNRKLRKRSGLLPSFQKCEACSHDLRGAKRRHVRGPDSREGRFTLVAPGAGASTLNQWTGSVLSRTLLLLGVRGRFSPPRCTHRCRATVAREVSVPASVARSLEPPFSDHRAAYRCSRVETWRWLQQSSRSRD